MEELINCHADANATDDSGSSRPIAPIVSIVYKACCAVAITRLVFCHSGKSALHWAAAVNNVEAAVVLLKNGANKDMQDNKVSETKRPLEKNLQR